MYRSYPNVSPVANKYLGHKLLLKAQADHENHIKNARSVLNLSKSTPRFHLSSNFRHKHVKEHELSMIKQENERLRRRMIKTESLVDTHNNYVLHSLNIIQRQREKIQHENEFHRLQKQISQVRPSYPVRRFQQDYAKKQDVKKRLSRFPSNDK
ncbi:unnamed protein product [Rotaria sordida]|uniref:Uncharacterized protein n=1 Tax=Rotaria sordida TaxID=392033 RepID=A0A814YK45_9BILA|nr:unnamed protein product [Rotaria sordida]CAF1129119.1 unnamed protein product [Rotaria sordida]CAF1231032.1 unnamed protein product [Rotaria sordida]CAF3730024.1 unnamed protein product [Rotaria sordida]CAF3818819.1 unnamed protein product [Rotaria sordida]